MLAQSSVEREVEAVDSGIMVLLQWSVAMTTTMLEFHLASQVDACRLQQLRNHIAVNGHPMSKFLWG